MDTTYLRPRDMIAWSAVTILYPSGTCETAHFVQVDDGFFIFARENASMFQLRWGCGVWFTDPDCQTVEVVAR